ncbi:Nif3-like dinuclear metal center hexameric protein [Helicobacter sp. 12S02232-10]|uniref:Nif3-like dinuclear metal center hexameric protein n=1 Tax=Helicobacter sp. 12S02232-10 TaxID=1476197 RepID=UPI000BA6E09E|nr:Nif3-like dinuclear metal center hexameric protein [Helicobacter sp. 12S02232-10]PAF47904.1 Nif3-like dinuclear metal center hexameric protein [Helicobacter sp. 12S02232-10]
MKKVCEIYDVLNSISPFELQEKWDNSGLNLGNEDEDAKEIYLCLEVTPEIAQSVSPQSLIIAHHPLFFKPLKSFSYNSYPANIAKILIEKNCSLICMHTNFDTTHLNPYFAQNILGFEGLKTDGIALSGAIQPIKFSLLAEKIKQKLNLPSIKCAQSSDIIDFVSIVCGAGSSHLYQNSLKQNSCLITGDIKYHDAMIAKSLKISLIDAEHYQSEKNFPQILQTILKTKGYQAIIKDCKNPFTHL